MNLTHQKRAVGIFSSHEQAEHALHELRNSGFSMSQVSIIAKDVDSNASSQQMAGARVEELADTTHVDEGAKTGAATGGAVGGLTGLLVGLGTLAIPGVGPIMLAGATATAIATTLAGGAIGAAAGGLVGSLIGLGIPEDRARAYQDHVSHGKYLVIVDGTEAELLQAEEILKRTGINEWEVHGTPTSEESISATTRL